MQLMRDNFAVFILSHGRADRVYTIQTLKKCNYTGKIYLIIDDEDEQIDEYKKLGYDVITFCKIEEMEKTDTIDNYKDHRLVVYARNVCHDIAKRLNLKYFLVLDDDYVNFRFRKEINGVLKTINCRQIDKVFEAMLDFLDETNALTVALSQTGDFIGGTDSNVFKNKLVRKAMNSFFCRTDRPFKFLGSTNEDVNAYVSLGNQGELFFTVAECSLDQIQTQANKGGLTDIYLANGTYVKSFYSVICAPQAVKVQLMGQSNRRLHHRVYWNYCTPKIISEKHKKR